MAHAGSIRDASGALRFAPRVGVEHASLSSRAAPLRSAVGVEHASLTSRTFNARKKSRPHMQDDAVASSILLDGFSEHPAIRLSSDEYSLVILCEKFV